MQVFLALGIITVNAQDAKKENETKTKMEILLLIILLLYIVDIFTIFVFHSRVAIVDVLAL